MYWPVGTPKAYATSTHAAPISLHLSHDHSPNPRTVAICEQSTHPKTSELRSPLSNGDDGDVLSPKTPITPVTSVVQSVESNEIGEVASKVDTGVEDGVVDQAARMKEPNLALKVCRTGHIFVVATATTMTLWQTKVFAPRNANLAGPLILF